VFFCAACDDGPKSLTYGLRWVSQLRACPAPAGPAPKNSALSFLDPGAGEIPPAKPEG